MKPAPGFTTTEFYTTLLMNIIAILALFGVHLSSGTSQYTQAIAVLAAGIATGIYTHSRQQVKVASIKSTPAQSTPVVSQPIVTIAPIAAPTQAATTSEAQPSV
jgi:hypothetical protein